MSQLARHNYLQRQIKSSRVLAGKSLQPNATSMLDGHSYSDSGILQTTTTVFIYAGNSTDDGLPTGSPFSLLHTLVSVMLEVLKVRSLGR